MTGFGQIVVSAKLPAFELIVMIPSAVRNTNGMAREARLVPCDPLEQIEARHDRQSDVRRTRSGAALRSRASPSRPL